MMMSSVRSGSARNLAVVEWSMALHVRRTSCTMPSGYNYGFCDARGASHQARRQGTGSTAASATALRPAPRPDGTKPLPLAARPDHGQRSPVGRRESISPRREGLDRILAALLIFLRGALLFQGQIRLLLRFLVGLTGFTHGSTPGYRRRPGRSAKAVASRMRKIDAAVLL